MIQALLRIGINVYSWLKHLELIGQTCNAPHAKTQIAVSLNHELLIVGGVSAEDENV